MSDQHKNPTVAHEDEDPRGQEEAHPRDGAPRDKPWHTDEPQADDTQANSQPENDDEDQPHPREEQTDPAFSANATKEQLEARLHVLELALRASEARLAETLKRQDDMVTAYRKMQTEFEGAKQRLDRERNETLERERRTLIEVFFDPLDNLERSIAAATATTCDDKLLDGLKLVLRQFQNSLMDLGLERLDPKGQPFSPELHEALSVKPVKDPAQDGMVLEVWQVGYKVGDRLLRPARVLIGKKQ